VLEQWQRLHALRVGFERVERRGELRRLAPARQVVLRHVLAEIMSGSLELDQTGTADPRLAEARAAAEEDRSALDELAHRDFDFGPAPTRYQEPPDSTPSDS
jgi:hypothetical protein